MNKGFVRVVAHWKPTIPADQSDPVEHQLTFDLLVNEEAKVVVPSTLRFGAYGDFKSQDYFPFALLDKTILFSSSEESEGSCDVQYKLIRVGEYFSYSDENGDATYQIKQVVSLG